VLETATRLVRQMPDGKLEVRLPNRPRSYRMLMHHIFQIPTAYLDTEDTGATLTYERLVVPAPAEMRTGAAVGEFRKSVRALMLGGGGLLGRASSRPVPTYFGKTSRREMFERTV
jgi:hypothetical protein